MRIVLVCLLLAAATGATAQTMRVRGTEAAHPKSALAVERARADAASPVREIRLKPLASTVAKAAGTPNAFLEKSYQIGVVRSVDSEAELVSSASLEWRAAASTGGRTARIALSSPQAGSLRLGLNARSVPGGVQLRFYSREQPERVLGPVAAEEMTDATFRYGVYWTPVTEGESQVVELWAPESVDVRGIRVEVEVASHIAGSPAGMFKDAAFNGLGTAGACHEDVACVMSTNPELAHNVRSVMKLVYTRNGMTYLCTGTLINDAHSSQVPYVYTAAHCIDSQAVAATLNTIWLFEAATCGSKATRSYQQLTGGATLLYVNTDTDVALVRLSDRAPDGAWFSGWDASTPALGQSMVGLHHPRGDLKKLAIGDVAPYPNTSYLGASWLSGATEPGSSGSGLFTRGDGEYLLRGALRGGSSSCQSSGNLADPSNLDYYSRIDQAFVALQPWLDAPVAPIEDFSGLWNNPDEPGWGIALMQAPDNKVFITWYTYDANGAPAWFVAPAVAWKSAVALDAPLYRTEGSPFDAPYEKSRFSVLPAGNVHIEFGRGAATATITVGDKTLVKPITRMAF